MTSEDFTQWSRPTSSEGDVFLQGVVQTAPDGRPLSRTAVVRRSTFKYPMVRIEQTLTPGKAPEWREMVADHLLVRLQPDADPEELSARIAASGARLSEPLGKRGTWMVSIPQGDIAIYDRTLAALTELDPAVRSASPDFIVHTMAPLPNDSNFAQQYGLHNTGQSSGLADADIDAPEAGKSLLVRRQTSWPS